jgi:pimeloyl-ACP methyl ester carboxylesterase
LILKHEKGDYLQPMEPWPELKPYANSIKLPLSKLEIFFFDAGSTSQSAALLIHGLGDDADTWRHLITPLSKRWRIIAPDLPGFGRSAKPEATYTENFFRQVLHELLEALDIHQVTLMGHSLGGALAQSIALERQGEALGLILLDGGLLLKPLGLNLRILLFLIPGIGEMLYSRLRKNPQAAYETLQPYYKDIEGLPESEREFLFLRVNQRVWDDGQRRAYFSTLRNYAAGTARQQPNIKEKLANLHLPTLIFWGEDDQIYSPQCGDEMAELQPDARLVILPGQGHNVMQEAPRQILDKILADERFAE